MEPAGFGKAGHTFGHRLYIISRNATGPLDDQFSATATPIAAQSNRFLSQDIRAINQQGAIASNTGN